MNDDNTNTNNRIEEIVKQIQGLSSDAELTVTLLNELLVLQVGLVADAAYHLAVKNVATAAASI